MPRQEQIAARHAALRRQFLAILQEQQRALTDAELAVLDTFLASDHHFDAVSLIKEARQRNPAITEAVAAEILSLLCEYKVAHEIVLNSRTLYEHFHLNTHHDHFVCVTCGGITNFYDPLIESLQAENARNANFRPLIHRLEIYGVCSDCVARKAEIHPLCDCLAGETARVVRVAAHADMRRHIAEMGLVPGARIRVLGMNPETKTAMVAVGRTRFAVSGEITRKVLVTTLDPSQEEASANAESNPEADNSDSPLHE